MLWDLKESHVLYKYSPMEIKKLFIWIDVNFQTIKKGCQPVTRKKVWKTFSLTIHVFVVVDIMFLNLWSFLFFLVNIVKYDPDFVKKNFHFTTKITWTRPNLQKDDKNLLWTLFVQVFKFLWVGRKFKMNLWEFYEKIKDRNDYKSKLSSFMMPGEHQKMLKLLCKRIYWVRQLHIRSRPKYSRTNFSNILWCTFCSQQIDFLYWYFITIFFL